MAAITESELKAAIKSGNFSNVYLLYGQDFYAIGQYTKALVKRLVSEDAQDMNLHEFEGRDLDIGELTDACEALPVFSEYSCVTISNLNVKNKALFGKDSYDGLISLIKNMSETTVLIIYYTGFDICEGKKNADPAYKRLIDNVTKYGSVCCFRTKTEADTAKDIAAAVKKQKGIIGYNEALQLARICAGNRLLINSEIDKLVSYANGEAITSEMIGMLCAGQDDTKIYELTDAVLRRDKAAAMQRYNELCAMQFEVMPLLYSITGAVVDAYRVKTAIENRHTAADVKTDFKYGARGFVVDSAMRSAGRTDIERLRKCISLLIECEMQIKSRPKELHSILIEETIIKMLS